MPELLPSLTKILSLDIFLHGGHGKVWGIEVHEGNWSCLDRVFLWDCKDTGSNAHSSHRGLHDLGVDSSFSVNWDVEPHFTCLHSTCKTKSEEHV